MCQLLVGRPIFTAGAFWWGNLLSAQALWTALVAAFLWLVLNRHRFGEHLLFIGDNQDVARCWASTWCARRSSCSTLMGALAALAASS